MRSTIITILLTIATLTAGCAGPSIFPDIGDNMSNPLSLAVDSDRAILYVVNSNYRVSYKNGSIHVVDISDPAHPVRSDYMTMLQFAGQVYFDSTVRLLYTPDRYSTSETDTIDSLLRINLDSDSTDYGTQSEFNATDDPFGIACCDGQNRILAASEAGYLDYYELDNSLAYGSLNLTSELSTGVTLSGGGAKRVTIIGSQAVVARTNDGLWVVNLDQLGVSGTYPVDYLIANVPKPRGITSDDNYVYVVSVDYPNGVETPSLFILDISSLTPRTDNTTAEVIDKDDSGLVFADIALAGADAEEIVLGDDMAYVTHFGDDSVSVVDLTQQVRTEGIAVGDEPFGMALLYNADDPPIPTHLFVANSGGNTVSVIDLSTNSVIATYP